MHKIKSSSRTHLKVAAIQQACTANIAANLQMSIQAIQEAAAAGAELVLLQELHSGLYFCQQEDASYFDLAETIPGPTTNRLGDLARQLGIVIVTSLFEKRAPGLYHNTAVVIEKDGSIAGCYRKMHIPDDPGYYEKFYFTPGDLGFSPIVTSVGKLGVLVCWDQWYPEAARLMALAGADLLLYPTAIGWGSQEKNDLEKEQQLTAWMLIQRSHAIANGIPVIVANRVGFESKTSLSLMLQPSSSAKLNIDSSMEESGINDGSHENHGNISGIRFWGNSFISGPQGELLAHALTDQPINLIADIDLTRMEIIRRGWPFLRDRRIDYYEGLLKRYLD